MQVDAVVEQSSVAGQRGQVASMVTQDTVCRMCGTDVDWFCERTVNGDIFHEYCAEMLEIDDSDEYFSAESSGGSFMQKPFGEPSHGGKGYLFAATSMTRMPRRVHNPDGSIDMMMLFDTASDEHCVTSGTSVHGWEVQGVPRPKLDAATGNKVMTSNVVEMVFSLADVKGVNHPVSTTMRVSPNLKDDIFSGMKIISRGTFRAVLDSDGSYLEAKHDANVRVPLYLIRNRLYLG